HQEWEEPARLSAAGHDCVGATSRVHREVYARFCERQGVRLPLPTRRFHQDGKQELGLGDYQGRTWPGLHRHLALVCLMWCYALLRNPGLPTTTTVPTDLSPRTESACRTPPTPGGSGHHHPVPRVSRAHSATHLRR